MDIFLLAALGLLSVGGVVLAVLQLPGAWLVLIAAAGYDWHYGWERIGWQWLVGLTVVAALSELLDALAGVLAARRAGASRRASIGALIGGFAGMILFTVPIPVLGTILGGIVGCFVGALGAEMTVRAELGHGTRVAVAAAIGRVLGLAAKTAAAIGIGGAVVCKAVLAMG